MNGTHTNKGRVLLAHLRFKLCVDVRNVERSEAGDLRVVRHRGGEQLRAVHLLFLMEMQSVRTSDRHRVYINKTTKWESLHNYMRARASRFLLLFFDSLMMTTYSCSHFLGTRLTHTFSGEIDTVGNQIHST